jgi:transcriptional regulator with XRE-family HTH domain
MHSQLESIGAQIAAARKAASRSQQAVAEPLGMSRATISGIENGTIKEIGLRKLMALCASLGLEVIVRPRGRPPTLPELRAEQSERSKRS